MHHHYFGAYALLAIWISPELGSTPDDCDLSALASGLSHLD
jgi:hypothetical protein